MNDAAPAADLAAEESCPPREVTLELGLPPGASARLWRTRALAAHRAGRTRTQAMRIAWHEPRDGALKETGDALLEVRQGASRLWRMEPGRRDGHTVWPLGTPAPACAEVAEPPEGSTPPIATFAGHRRSPTLSPESGLAAVALLDGQLTIGTMTSQIARLLIRGTPKATFAMARALLDEVPLFIPARSLSGEVSAALHGVTAPPAPVLHPDLDVDDAFAHVVSQLAAALAHHAPGARDGATTEPVHQMRVALRRLRSALSLFRKVASSPEVDRARGDLGALARALGPARDWDVFLSGTGRTVGKLLPHERAVIRLGAAARRKRALAYAELARLLDGPGFQGTLLDLVELAVVRPWQLDATLDPSTQDGPRLIAFARHSLDRKLRQVTQAGDDLSRLTAEELHDVRIRCKRLRYAAEFFAPLMPGRQTRRFLRRLAAVQERLGHLNDGAVAGELLADLGTRGFAAGVVHGYLASRSAGGRTKAEKSWKRFRRADPFWE